METSMNDDLSPRARALVDRGRRDLPTADDRLRNKRSVLARVAVVAATGAISSATATSSAASMSGAGAAIATGTATAIGAKLGTVMGIALSFAIGGSAAYGVTQWRSSERAPHAEPTLR